MKIDNIECEILCNNEPLMEYQEELRPRLNSDPKGPCRDAKSCYIVSEVGKVRAIPTASAYEIMTTSLTYVKHFMARIKSDPHLFDVSFHLWIDGQRVQRMCVESDQSYKMEGFLVGQSQRRPYVFSSIATTSKSTLASLGSLCTLTQCFQITTIS